MSTVPGTGTSKTIRLLKSQDRYMVTIDPNKIKADGDFAAKKAPSWIKLPAVRAKPTTDGAGGYRRDMYALWVRLKSNTEFGRKDLRLGGHIGWYKILYSTITDPRNTGNTRVKWLHFIKERRTGQLHLCLLSSPPNIVHDTLVNAASRSVFIKQQIMKVINEKLSLKKKYTYDPSYGIFI